MGRVERFIGIFIIIVLLGFGLFKFTNKYNLNILNKNISLNIKVKDAYNARSFTFDEKGNLYLAFADTIRIVNKDGKDEVVIRESKLDILDIIYYHEKLYISTDNRIIEYDIEKRQYKEIINNIPNNGINKKINLLINNEKLYFSIGSNTNDGIADEKLQSFDIATNNWILNGENYGQLKTGAFLPYSNASYENQKIDFKQLGNASVLYYDLKNKNVELFAHGIRNINGWDVDDSGNIKAIVGGIEDTGPRNIKDDKDYIYLIKGDNWYGWPDYSGGDPITSTRFTDFKMHKFLIKNHIDKMPEGPIYQSENVSSLNGLTIDKFGEFLEKDTIIFADNTNLSIYSLSKDGVKSKLINLDSNSRIEKILFYDGRVYVLDSKVGVLYDIKNTNKQGIFDLPVLFYFFVVGFLVSIALAIFIKYKIKNKKHIN